MTELPGHGAQQREHPEPEERSYPVPRVVLATAALLLAWGIGYILINQRDDDPAIGDQRTLSTLAGKPAGALADGAQIYGAHCAACHQATGAGLPGVFPALAGSEWVLAQATLPVNIVLHGVTGKLSVKGAEYDGAMPAFKDKLSDAEIAAVLSHIRSKFGNAGAPIGADVVKAEREAGASRTEPWNGGAELGKFGAPVLVAGAAAAPPSAGLIELPPETAKLKPASLPGYAVALQKCATCHSVDYILYQPPGMGLEEWTKIPAKMQHVFGAQVSDDDVKQIGAYLAVTYGSAKAADLPAALRVAAAVAPPKAGAAVDAKVLLANNACLSCHAIDSKIVGPAYRDVAKKYRGDTAALDKVAASIRAGGSGKWGVAPMPPFARLTEQEARALATFVLRQ